MKKYRVLKFKNDFYFNGITYKKNELLKECEDLGRIAYKAQNDRYFSKTFIENNCFLFEEVKEETGLELVIKVKELKEAFARYDTSGELKLTVEVKNGYSYFSIG